MISVRSSSPARPRGPGSRHQHYGGDGQYNVNIVITKVTTREEETKEELRSWDHQRFIISEPLFRYSTECDTHS